MCCLNLGWGLGGRLQVTQGPQSGRWLRRLQLREVGSAFWPWSLPAPGCGGSSHTQHHEERSRYMLRVCPSVYSDLHPFICPTVHPHTDCPGSPLTPCSLLGPPPTSWGGPVLQWGETPGKNQIGAQVGLHHRVVLRKESGHVLPSQLSRVGLPLTHFGLWWLGPGDTFTRLMMRNGW